MLALRSPWGWYRIQKPLKPGNTKKIRKKMTKSPISGLAPKIRKKIPKIYKNGHFLANFGIFRYFFRIFVAKPEMGESVISSVFFLISRLEGFLYSVPPQGDLNVSSVLGPTQMVSAGGFLNQNGYLPDIPLRPQLAPNHPNPRRSWKTWPQIPQEFPLSSFSSGTKKGTQT